MIKLDASNLVQSFVSSPDKGGTDANSETRQLDPDVTEFKILSEA